MEKKTYSDKLKDPRWQKKRLEILDRDNFTCKACGDTQETLNVHHIFYLPHKEPWDIPSGFLVTLCESCHKPEPCDYDDCKDCPDYHLPDDQRCYGKSAPAEEIITEIADFLNFLWNQHKGGICVDTINYTKHGIIHNG
jgi:hypothetical protein